MIKFSNTEVFNFEGALRGMRNPLKSWEKSDSGYCEDLTLPIMTCSSKVCPIYDSCKGAYDGYLIGPNDLALAQKLIKAGSDHRKFLRQIFVSVDITAPLYWWKEFDTYKVATVANSESTMHTIHKKEFTLDDFSHEHVTTRSLGLLSQTIHYLNECRDLYVNYETSDNNGYRKPTKKEVWWQIIQLLPSSFNQMRTVTLNYETLRNIYGSRRNHKLDEWSVGFMEWIDSLPYSEELIKY